VDTWCPIKIVGDINNVRSACQKWLKYDHFADSECRECIALPVRMRGCAHHAIYVNRNIQTHMQRGMLAFIEASKKSDFYTLMKRANKILYLLPNSRIEWR
jgi:sulfatase maturation enzyme AslB (radical SAM superfamily)